jgi:hypothetical protein
MQATLGLAPAPAGTTIGAHRRPRRWLRNVLVSTVSILTMLIAASYVLLSGGQAMAATVRDGQDPYTLGHGHNFQPNYRDCPVSHHGSQSHDTEVVYGTVSAKNGLHAKNVIVKLEGINRAVSRESTQITVGRPGTYRAVVHLPAGQYKVTVEMTVNGHRVDDSHTARLVDDHAYEVSAVARNSRVFSILPVSSY